MVDSDVFSHGIMTTQTLSALEAVSKPIRVVLKTRHLLRLRRTASVCGLALVMFCCLTGCASRFAPSELPAKYAARPLQDFSRINLTSVARPIVDEELIQPGDRLTVAVDTGTLQANSKVQWNVTVDDKGQAQLPIIGAVQLAGLNDSQAEAQIVQASLQRDIFLTPSVSVKREEKEQQSLLVTGAVGSPGPLTFSDEHLTLADIIVRAGGVLKNSTGIVTLSHTKRAQRLDNEIMPVSATSGQSSEKIDLAQTSESQLAQILVPPGAVVDFQHRTTGQVKMTGVISNQVLEMPVGRSLRLTDAITLAGGQKYSNWIMDSVTISRYVPSEKQRILIKGSIRKARKDPVENLVLAPNDIVNVDENILTFTMSTISGLVGIGTQAFRGGI